MDKSNKLNIETLNISGDVGLLVKGATFEECLKNVCIGMYSLITDIQDVKIKKSIDVFVEEDSLESIVVCLLNELIFQLEVRGFIGKTVDISLTENTGILKTRATVKGETFNPQRHTRKLLIKAATYHNLSIIIEKDTCTIQVVFDI